MPGPVLVRPLGPADIAPAAALHGEVLGEEFVARAGPGFLREYYRAWVSTDSALALVAEVDGQVAGVLLGSQVPARHYRTMVTRHGWRLAGRLVAHGLTHPAFGRELVVTRALRYARALVRMAGARWTGRGAPRDGSSSSEPSPSGPSGEVTHVLVDPARRGQGLARALLEEAAARARGRGLARLSLVTTAELASSGFYDRLGWTPRGRLESRSGESFAAYDLWLAPRG